MKMITAKMPDFHDTASTNLELPLLRISVDHCTAFDIVEKGIAREDSIVASIR
ncbi:MAG: 4-hydroxythreonine-4-phosphate dehydrogenase PdxA [Candidatus Thermoplasmatota archaeon]|jgi:4-hydroxythreonine-4-phosphate dehydrogenase|nr:4-hydroxythreonine-4-phosphate dehydrogenase PdxA [Candidatus Thermoplasmatota archaeon]